MVELELPAQLVGTRVVEYLQSKGVTIENLNNFLNALRNYLGASWPAFKRLLATQAGNNPSHPLWQHAIAGCRRGAIRGAVAAEAVVGFAVIVIVALIFFNGGKAAKNLLLEKWNHEALMADEEAIAAILQLLNTALESGRWRLKPNWTPEQAVEQILINLHTNKTPYFADLLEPVAHPPRGFKCPVEKSPQQAALFAQHNWKLFEANLEKYGITDLRTQEALSLFYCFRDQANP